MTDPDLTDLEKTQEFLNSLHIEYSIEFYNDRIALRLKADKQNVKGYPGFYADFTFLEDGSFEEVGIYE